MARYVTSATTPLAPAEAFSYMADVTHFVEWDPGVKSVRRVTGGDCAVGTAYDLTVQAGTKTVMRYEVTEHDAPRRILLVARTLFLTSVDEIRVEPSGSGSIVTYDATLTLNGPLGGFDPLLRVAFRRIGDRAAAGLKRVLASKTVTR
ncbi:MAG: SRPBCC family protein [Deltaproteobacteria bacterium]|nr:SRPBCC family protein [Deltaproteobacteria bacterium]